MEENTLFEAMRSFHDITQAVAFSSNEIALFYALLYTWNSARRPAVIEQWADTTSRNAGLSAETLKSARNKLIQKRVIFFDKKGNRGVPKYSLNPLFEIESPFLLREIPCKPPSKPPSKCPVSDGVNALSYQGEEKGKEDEEEKPTVEDCENLATNNYRNIDIEWVRSSARSFHGYYELNNWVMGNGKTLLPNLWKQRLSNWIEENYRKETQRLKSPLNQQPQQTNYTKSL